MNNPYTPSLKRLFYGRENIIKEMLRFEEAGQSVVLIGGRRCGKTCLMEHLHHHLLQATQSDPSHSISIHWPVLINFQGMKFLSMEHVLLHIQYAITQSFPTGSNLPALPNGNDCDPSTMETWLKEMDAHLAQVHLGGLTLLLDEIEECFGKPWHHDFMAFLRRLDDFTLKSRVWFVLAGSDALDNYRNESDGSPPLNTTRRMFLPGLAYAARKQMAVEPFVAAGRLPLTDEVLREVDRWAGGNVWILTLLLEYLFDQEKSDIKMVDNGARLLLDEQGDIFKRWARPLGKEGWDIYNQVAKQGVLGAKHIKGSLCRSIRALLEYQGLVWRRPNGDIEMGPELFREWAAEEGLIQEPFEPRPIPKETGELPPGYYVYDVAISYASPQLSRKICLPLNHFP